MNVPIQMPEELQKLEKDQGNLWSCSIPGYPHGILPFGVSPLFCLRVAAETDS